MTKSLQLDNKLIIKPIKILPQCKKLNKIMNNWLQKKFRTAEKNCKGFSSRERSKIGKDCQHTWKDLSLTTSWERLIVPYMAAIRPRYMTCLSHYSNIPFFGYFSLSS